MSQKFARVEERVSMTLPVYLCSLRHSPLGETTVTENVSPRGARVVSTQGWLPGDRLDFVLSPGDFSVAARVVYCYPRREREFALGLEFLEPATRWFSGALHGSGDNQHG